MTVPGQMNVDPNGAFTYAIPIAVTPATANMSPTLSLQYSSQNGDGFEGWGWTLDGIPQIVRCPRTLSTDSIRGSVNYDYNDRFCINGQRLMIAGQATDYGKDNTNYRTQIDGFSWVTAHGTLGKGPSSLEIKLKSGLILEFGDSANSRQLALGNADGTVRAWLLHTITDRKGNYLTVTYNDETGSDRTTYGEAYPIQIDYTGNATTTPVLNTYNSVRFVYDPNPRADSWPTYQAGSKLQNTRLLTDIETYNGSTLVMDYKLGYQAGSTTTRTHLTSVTLCDTSTTNCLAPTTFTWQGGGVPSVSTSSISPTQGYTLLSGDFNGDGWTDAVALNPNCPSGGTVFAGSASGFTAANITTTYSYALLTDPNHGNLTYSGPACFKVTPHFGDIDADGFTDAVLDDMYWQFNSGNWEDHEFSDAVQNNKTGTLSEVNLNHSLPTLALFGDYNGDLRMDGFLQGTSSGAAWFGTGDGRFNADTGKGDLGAGNALYAADFNGDGCTDMLAVGAANKIDYYCSPAVPSATTGSWSASQIATGDFNGDGNADIVVIGASVATLYLSTGTGAPTGTAISNSSGWASYRAVTGDWNGDGKTDLALVANGQDIKVFLSTGTDFTQFTTISNSSNPVSAVTADWNSDGADDLWIKRTNDLLATFKTGTNSYIPEVIAGVSNGIGANITVSYGRLNDATVYTKGTGSTYPDIDLVGPYYVVSRIDQSNGRDGAFSKTYSYSGAIADQTTPIIAGPRSNPANGGFLTFTQIVTTDLQTNIVATTTFRTDLPFTGMIQTQTATLGSLTLANVSNYYSFFDEGYGTTFPHITRSIANRTDLDGTVFPQLITDNANHWDDYGNMLSVTRTWADGKTMTITNTYNNDTTNWILGMLATQTIEGVIPGISDLMRHFNYQQWANTPLLKQEITEQGASDTSLTLQGDYGIDQFGNRNTVTLSGPTVTSRVSKVDYDSSGEFPHTLTDALNHVTSVTFNPTFGDISNETDPNNVQRSWGYDTFGRKATMTAPDSNKVVVTYSYCFGVNGGNASCPQYGAYLMTRTPTRSDGSTQNGAKTITYYDSLGRMIATDMEGFIPSGTAPWIRTETQYDAIGRVAQTSRPYFLVGGSAKWTVFTYDALGRVTQETFPDSSSTTFCYHGLTTAVTNAKNQTKTTVLNDEGLTASVVQGTGISSSTCNPTGSGSITTGYAYDAFGNPLTITTSNKTITNTFDVRGRKRTASDPDSGGWTYSYDGLGELTIQADAKSQQTTINYDKLTRPLNRTEADFYSKWVWDGATNGIGALSNACINSTCSSGNYQRTPTYDTLGRLSTDKLKLDGTNYTYTVAYNQDGQVDTIAYPSGFTAKYVYTTQGYLSQIKDNASGLVLWAANTRDAELHLTQQTAANSVVTYQTFDPNTGNLIAVCASTNTPPACDGGVANMQYGWDTIGNLGWRSDTFQGLTENFCYDGFNRLQNYALGSTCTSSGYKTMAYDTMGNITQKSDVCNTANCFSYGGSAPHELTSIAGNYGGVSNPNFGYDANGNMTCVYAPGQTCDAQHASRFVTWTSFNKVSQISQSGPLPNGIQLTYGAEHQRMKMCVPSCTSPTATIYYLYDPASGAASEKVVTNSATTWRDYIVADGGIVAERFKTGSTVTWKYFVLDHLGSIARLTDAAGAVSERDAYDAWGKRRNLGGSDDPNCSLTSATTRGYTDHEMVDSLCLINMNARMYDQTLGRFLSADTVVPDPTDSQSLNRFAYVEGNPLAMIDPSGHDGCTFITGSHICVNVKCKSQCTGWELNLGSGYDMSGAAFESTSGGWALADMTLGGVCGQSSCSSGVSGPFVSCDAYGCYTAGGPGSYSTSPIETITVQGGQFYAWSQIFGPNLWGTAFGNQGTVISLRFREIKRFGIGIGKWHGYIVVSDLSNRQYVSEAGPDGACTHTGCGFRGSIQAWTHAIGPADEGATNDYTLAAAVTEDVAAQTIDAQLLTFSDAYTEAQVPYYVSVVGPSSTSNTFAADEWQFVTGYTPALPNGVDAPGWPGN
jgi:RHS repeat-associated protein